MVGGAPQIHLKQRKERKCRERQQIQKKKKVKNVKDRNWDTVGWRVWANRFVLVTRFPIGVRSYGHADVALGCWPLASVVLSLSRRGSILRRSGLAAETGATVRVFSAKNNKQTQLTTPRPGSYLPPAS